MISGTAARSTALLLAALLVPGCAAAAATLTLDTLMRQFSQTSSAEARFTERKTLAILDTPVIMEGTLSYRRPDYIRKEVLRPDHSVFEIDGDRLSVETPQGIRTLSLDSHPLLRAFAASYRAILAGDPEELRRFYTVQLAGSDKAWVMVLEPTDSRVRERIDRITVSGSGNRIGSVRIDETSGDSSLMTIVTHDN